MARPRLLCLLHLPPPVHGVTVVNQRIAASAIVADHFDLEVVALRFAPSVGELGRISTRKLARAAATGVALAWRLVARRPDAVYLTMSPHGGALYRDCAYAAIARLAGVPRIYHLHARGVSDALRAGWRRRLGAWVFDGAWVIHVGRQLIDETAGLADPGRVVVVENGVPDRNPSGAIASSGRAVPRVLFLSNMIAEKGPVVLVEALAVLQRRGVALDATFAGAEGDGRTVAEFRAAVERHGLADRARYVGPVFDAAKDELLAAHDLFALPTSRDAFPLVVLEAMQHGLPVVASSVGGIPEIVVDGRTGFLVPPGDPAALADRIEQLATRPELRRRLGIAGRERYREQLTLEAFERRLVAALARCVGDDRGAPAARGTADRDSGPPSASLARTVWRSVGRASARITARRWRGVRFLCYHSVAPADQLAELSRRTLVLSADGFARHLAWIRRNDYVVVSMAEALRLLRSGDAGRAQFVCLTFDDGRMDNFACAWPLLRRAGYPAHFFVNSATIGQSLGTERFMTAEALRAVQREGGSIGSHGCHHADLTRLGEPEILRELVESRRELEAMTGGPIDTHAYPYASYDRRVLRAADAAGYAAAFTVCTGTALAIGAHNRLTLPRNTIRTGADHPDNYAIIRGGFDFTRLYSATRRRWIMHAAGGTA